MVSTKSIDKQIHFKCLDTVTTSFGFSFPIRFVIRLLTKFFVSNFVKQKKIKNKKNRNEINSPLCFAIQLEK